MIHRRWGALAVLLLALSGAACDAEGEFTPRPTTGQNHSPSPRPTAGTGVSGGVATSDVTVQPTSTPTASPIVPEVQRIEISKTAVSLALNPFDERGNPREVPGSVRLLATVVYADGSRNDLVTWTSLDPALVRVSESGEITPAASQGPPATGSAPVVVAARLKPSLTATCTVTVVP